MNERLDRSSSDGMIGNDKILCQYIERHKSKGIFLGDNPMHHATTILLSQIILMCVVGRITHFLLRPCHQTLLIAQIVAGIILGPSGLAQHMTSFGLIFPLASTMTLATFAEFGIIIHFFKMGVQVNPKLLWKIEKPAMIIGFVGHMSAIVLASMALHIVKIFSPGDSDDDHSVRAVIVTGGLTSLPVVSGFLNDMNILNSEIGRMALSTSMVSDVIMWIFYFGVINSAKAFQQGTYSPVLELVVSVCFFLILFFLLRPLVIWISNQNPQGKPMTEGHFLSIIGILLFVGLSAQVIGQPGFLAAFLFGFALPDGPPLGSALAERLDTVGSTLIVPAYCSISGLRTHLPLSNPRLGIIEIVILAGYLGKFVGTFMPSLHFQIPFWDAIALSLIMCCKGLVDLSMLNFLLNFKVLDNLSFTLALYNMVAVTGFATFVVYYIYDPSRRYRAYMRRSIRDSSPDQDLKLLVCVHNEENVYPIINLLQASNPTKTSPLSVIVLHLMELLGRATSILTKNESNKTKKSSYNRAPSQHISNVFDRFQMHNKGCVTLQFFTSIAPYTSMHDDICYMAMDTKSNIVIVPFHKQWTIYENVEISNASIRTLNINVLMKAPCSVGVLIDRSNMSTNFLVIYEKSYCEIAMIFLGGGDDLEALAYSLRIAQHPNVRLKIFWLRVKTHGKQRNMKNPYIDIMENVRYSNRDNKVQIAFKEEVVEDGEGTAQVMRMIEGNFSLVIVGRHHVADSPCILGLTEWCDLPELGPVGNLLATSDFSFSVLVVQEQHFYDFRCTR